MMTTTMWANLSSCLAEWPSGSRRKTAAKGPPPPPLLQLATVVAVAVAAASLAKNGKDPFRHAPLKSFPTGYPASRWPVCRPLSNNNNIAVPPAPRRRRRENLPQSPPWRERPAAWSAPCTRRGMAMPGRCRPPRPAPLPRLLRYLSPRPGPSS